MMPIPFQVSRLMFVAAVALTCGLAEATEPTKPIFTPPYPQRTNPFRLPDSQAALATRREAVVQQIDLKLKGFINVGAVRAVLEIDGQVVALAAGERRGDIVVMEISPPSLTLQRGRHRWSETLHDASQGKLAVAKGRS